MKKGYARSGTYVCQQKGRKQTQEKIPFKKRLKSCDLWSGL